MAISLAILIVAAMWCSIRYFATVAQARLVQDLVVDLRTQAYAKLQTLRFRFYDANARGSIINRVTADTRAIQMFLATVIMQTLPLVITLAVFISCMLATHVWLTIAFP